MGLFSFGVEDMSGQSSGWDPLKSPPSKKPSVPSTETSGLQGFSDYAGAAISVAQAGMNIASYHSQAKQYNKQAKNALYNLIAIDENYNLNKWILQQKVDKTLGSLKVRTGEGGSAMDLLQESAMNAGIEKYKLYEQYIANKFQAYKNYRKAKAAESAAEKGEIGAAIGTAAAIVAAPFTGGASLAFAGQASQVGGQMGTFFA
jgi:hypothetical protein